MGYSTDFMGEFEVDRKLDPRTVRLLRSIKDCDDRSAQKRYGMPDSWCQWELQDDDKTIAWDGGEKFYCYLEWIQFITHQILAPQGYKLNGEVEWQGEEYDDKGMIRIVDNEIHIGEAEITYKFKKPIKPTSEGTITPVLREIVNSSAENNLLTDGDGDAD